MRKPFLFGLPWLLLIPIALAQDRALLRPPKGASVAILVFQDLQCPKCRRDAPVEEEAARAHNIPLVRHDFPMHNWSFNAAVMARYFDSLGKDLGNQFRDYIFLHQPEITPGSLPSFATKFASEHKVELPFVIDPQQRLAAQVNADKELGQKINIRYTPTIFVVSNNPARPFVEVTDTNQLFQTVEAMKAK